jgi:hypothetical protein
MFTPEVKEAIEDIAASFPDAGLAVVDDGQGGAFVTADPVELGQPYAQATTWFGFHITNACPYADVYPLFVRGDLSRLDGKPLGEAMGAGNTFPPVGAPVSSQMPHRPAVQVSRRSNRRDSSGIETPVIKLLKVIRWLKSR